MTVRRHRNRGPMVPFVGALVGALVGVVFVGSWHLVASALRACWRSRRRAVVTGRSHDGLADPADAFGGGWTLRSRLEILKDLPSRHLRRHGHRWSSWHR